MKSEGVGGKGRGGARVPGPGKKNGRPTSDPAGSLRAAVTAFLTPEERDAAKKAAEAAGVSLSQWAREAIRERLAGTSNDRRIRGARGDETG